jgi:DNA N-6-adenine-methyltransferase (Dam)
MSNEWYTPSKYIEAAREVMGDIDLDPASCEMANRTVKAKRYYTREQNGLLQPWSGRVWLNPPYNATDDCHLPQPTWSRRLRYEYSKGHVQEAILLISAATKQKWFHELLDFPICLMLERIFFHRPGKEPEELRHGNTAVYLRPNEAAFIEVFSQFGAVVKRVSQPVQKPITLDLWEREVSA